MSDNLKDFQSGFLSGLFKCSKDSCPSEKKGEGVDKLLERKNIKGIYLSDQKYNIFGNSSWSME